MKSELAPVLTHIRNLRGNLSISTRKWRVISPFEVGLDTVKEFFDPDSYYKDHINTEEYDNDSLE